MKYISEIQWKFLFQKTYFRLCEGSIGTIGKNVSIKNSRIIITQGSKIVIGNNVRLENCVISVANGSLTIGDHTIIGDSDNSPLLNIERGEIQVGHHTKINAKRFWVRYGGIASVGNYTNINANSEVRCDEKVTIGDYNQISYGVNIWDTNTHTILPVTERRELTKKYYPYFGKELSKPLTSPVFIGDDCWLGQGTAILKGSTLGNGVIVGYGTVIPGKVIPSNSTAVMDVCLKIKERI